MKRAGRRIYKKLSTCWLVLLLLAGPPWSLAQHPVPSAPGNQPPPAQSQSAARDVHARVTETLIDSSITDDPALDKLIAVYSPKVRELEVVIGKLKGDLKKGGAGAGSMGNFVTDGMRAQASLRTGASITLALMNGGGVRRNSIGEGQLRARDIFDLLPFENALITLELTGAQLMKVLEIAAAGEAQSGARITYTINADKKSEFESAKLLDAQDREHEIDPKASYTIVTIDYLYRVGGNRYGILREGKNVKELDLTVRDAIIAYVKTETAAGRDIKPKLDNRFVLDRANSVLSGEARPR
jgi:2',3'-cyclic-nucleotide 2'-phosphodiesterase (5'-nucleotidase family)